MAAKQLQQIKIPDLGTKSELDVIEIMVKPGDTVDVDTPLITLESEKASMDIPSIAAGVIETVMIKLGDKVKAGDLILTLLVEEESSAVAECKVPDEKPTLTLSPDDENLIEVLTVSSIATDSSPAASPIVRRLAREFDIDLSCIQGTGRKGRIQKSDLQAYVKSAMQGQGVSGLPLPPVVDHAAFGDIDIQPLSKIRRFSATNLHRNWLQVPHVTQFDEVDITELEAFRQAKKALLEKQGIKLTSLVFIMKAVVAALKQFPEVNASLDSDGEHLIIKKYFHLGVAVDTPNGLVVPVIRHVDQKGILELAQELGEVSEKARTKGLTPSDMQGSCFTISSLGGIGGTAFTPIVNMPDVAILGVSRSSMKPVFQHGQFVPRLMLPLSLSYDHRVIDGAQGARFITALSQSLADIRNLLL